MVGRLVSIDPCILASDSEFASAQQELSKGEGSRVQSSANEVGDGKWSPDWIKPLSASERKKTLMDSDARVHKNERQIRILVPLARF